MAEQTSQSRWQWAVIIVLAAGLLYLGWQLRGGATRIRDAAEELVELQNRVRSAVADQQEVTQRLREIVRQVEPRCRGLRRRNPAWTRCKRS